MSEERQHVVVMGSEQVPALQLPTGELVVFDPANCPASGTTTADGLATTVIDTTRTELNDHWNGMALLITSGAQNGQVREITDWDLGTGTFTVAPAFGGPILTGATYKVLTNLPADIDVAAIEAKLDDATTGLAALKTLIDALEAKLDVLPDIEYETEWAAVANCDSVASDEVTNLTVGTVTPTFPTGSTRVRAILVASIHILNVAANVHHIAFRVEGNKDAGVYSTLLDLIATAQLGLVNVDGASEGWCGAVDVTALVDASGSVYNFRFVVDSDNAGAVRYITYFTLVLVYHM